MTVFFTFYGEDLFFGILPKCVPSKKNRTKGQKKDRESKKYNIIYIYEKKYNRNSQFIHILIDRNSLRG